MTIFRFETRRQLRNTVTWTAVIVVVLWLMLYGFYPLVVNSRTAMEEMLASFPPGVLAAFGINMDDVFAFAGFSRMVYLYDALLGAIMATGTAAAIFAREKQNKSSDFLLTKPLSRSEIFVQKLAACLTLIGVLNIPYVAVYTASYLHYTGSVTRPDLLTILCLFLMQLVFVSFGIATAVFMRRIRSSSATGVSIGMFAFLLSMVYSLSEKDVFRFISPLSYFNPDAVFKTGRYDMPSVATAIVLMLGMTAAAYVRFTTADVPA